MESKQSEVGPCGDFLRQDNESIEGYPEKEKDP